MLVKSDFQSNKVCLMCHFDSRNTVPFSHVEDQRHPLQKEQVILHPIISMVKPCYSVMLSSFLLTLLVTCGMNSCNCRLSSFSRPQTTPHMVDLIFHPRTSPSGSRTGGWAHADKAALRTDQCRALGREKKGHGGERGCVSSLAEQILCSLL